MHVLRALASDPADQANGMTAIYLPENVKAPELLPNLLKKGVIFAGGLHKEIATKYIRVGHMGVSVVSFSHILVPIDQHLLNILRLTPSAMTSIVQSQLFKADCRMQATKRLRNIDLYGTCTVGI